MRMIELREADVKPCRTCQQPIAFLRNKKGKYYVVNADYAINRCPATFKTNFHRCVK